MDEKLKIAICFSGFPRVVKETYESIYKYLIIPNDIKDIFIHTWVCQEGANIGNRWMTYKYRKSDTECIFKKYSPKCYVEEFNENIKIYASYLPNDLTDKYRKDCLSRFGVQSQFYSFHKSIELASKYQKKHNFIYDVIIKLRFDLIFLSPIIIKDLDLNILHVSDFMTILKKGWVNDWIAISNYDNMKKHAELWNNINSLLDQGIVFHPERLVAKNLTNYNIKVNPTFINRENHMIYKDFYSETNKNE